MLHVHSTASDGWISPERVLKAYADRGYDFLCLTDHWMVTPKPKYKGKPILFIPGVELNGGKTAVGDFHFVGIGVKSNSVFQKKENPEEYTARQLVNLIRKNGGFVVIAHPSWNGVSWVDLQDVARDLMGLEVWNSGCDVEVGRGQSEVQWDDLLSRGYRIWGLAVDDAHRFYRDAMKAWVMVKAASLTKKDICQALKRGTFYSSTGPAIYDLTWNKKEITIKTSPVKRMDMVSDPTRGRTIQAHQGRSLTEHSFTLPKKGATYVRIRIKDECGQFAWTNPIFLSR